MTGLFPQHVIDEIRDRADIVDVISNYVPLKKAGSSFKALCPFHNEKTPSFNVSPAKQIYHCFGCGKGGNVFSFIMEFEKVPFPEAVHIVADRIGYKIPQEAIRKADNNVPQRKQLYRINAYVANLYHSHLLSKEGEPARNYLHDRGISDESISLFKLGLSPDSWDWLIRQSTRPESMALMKTLGLVLPRGEDQGYYDRFRNRLMFPIPDSQDRIAGFGGRSLDGSEPKYVNSPDSPLFSKMNNLYGLNVARMDATRIGSMMVMEGYTDVIMAHQAGFKNAVATLGTALTERHVRLLKRYVEQVIMVFDGDEAGQKASQRGIDLALRGELQVRIAELPQGKDPCDFISAEGADIFAKAIDQAKDLFDYKIGIGRMRDDFNTVEGQSAVIDNILASVANFTWRNRPKQELLMKKLSAEFRVSETSVRDRLAGILARNTAAGRRAEPDRKGGRGRRGLGDWVIELMLASPEYARLISEGGVFEHLDTTHRTIAEAVFSALKGEDKAVLAKAFSRLEQPQLCETLSRISALMPESIDCDKMYEDICNFVHKHFVSQEISKETEHLIGLENRTDEKEAEYLRKVAALKKRERPNKVTGKT
ncbi:MAG: DNA primase [Planctomycetota bacterium]